MDQKKHGRSYRPSPSLYDITQTTNTVLSLLGLTDELMEPTQPHICGKIGGRAYRSDAISPVLDCARSIFDDGTAQRILLYNPDAIGYWIYKKYSGLFRSLREQCQLSMRLATVYPPVTPVCFGSMYTGMIPRQHGIIKYEKHTLPVMTLFDRLTEAGKKVAIVSTSGDSISILFLNRSLDYYIYDTVRQCNEKALELIRKKTHDVIVLYNGNYDYWMHRNSPTGPVAVHQLKQNINTFLQIHQAVETNWTATNNVLAFLPDHGCHHWYGILGNHGNMIPKDMEIPHFYSFLKRK